MTTDLRDVAREHATDLRHAAGLLAGLDAIGKDAAAYDHASHGCDFEHTDVACPVCTPAPAEFAADDDATGFAHCDSCGRDHSAEQRAHMSGDANDPRCAFCGARALGDGAA